MLASRVIHPLLVLLYCTNNVLRISSFVAVAIHRLAGCGRRALRLWGGPSTIFLRQCVVFKCMLRRFSFPDVLLRSRQCSFRASHAFPSLMFTSCSVEVMKLPRYLKSSTCFIFSTLRLFIPRPILALYYPQYLSVAD